MPKITLPRDKKQWALFAGSLFDRLLFYLRLIERKHRALIRKNKWVARLTHSSLFSLKTGPICRGLAIGMFWAFIPMPFQMAPASLFCLFNYANLPIALVAVWISNPFTYLPIFYAQYKIGVWLYAEEHEIRSAAEFEQIGGFFEGTATMAWDTFFYLFAGGLTTAAVFGIAGYLVGYPLSRYLRRHSKKRWKKRKSIAHTH